MSEQTGPSVDAIRARQAALASRHSALAEADRALADALVTVHDAMRESVARLDAVAAEIERVVADRTEFAVDTALGVREFQKFLLVKHREIESVVAGAHELDRAQSAVLRGLRARYAGRTV